MDIGMSATSPTCACKNCSQLPTASQGGEDPCTQAADLSIASTRSVSCPTSASASGSSPAMSPTDLPTSHTATPSAGHLTLEKNPMNPRHNNHKKIRKKIMFQSAAMENRGKELYKQSTCRLLLPSQVVRLEPAVCSMIVGQRIYLRYCSYHCFRPATSKR